MKIRNGFVSNSSSSSFIIRGAKFTKKEVADVYNKNYPSLFDKDDDGDLDYNDIDFNYGKPNHLTTVDTRYYFGGGDQTDDCIVGVRYGALSDGYVDEIYEPTVADDEDLKSRFKDFGFNVPEKLNTFIQFISNDNY